MQQYEGTLRHISMHWPSYFFGGGGGAIAAVFLVILSVSRGWLWLIPIAFAFILMLFYFLVVSIWAASQRYDRPRDKPAELLYKLGRFESEDKLAHIDFGERHVALALMRFLSTGRLTVVDIYSPQIMPGQALMRARQKAPHGRSDPRVLWISGAIDLLPLPDASVIGVTLFETATLFGQEGDRRRLFKEIYRILKPGGRLVMAERMRTQTNWLVMGTRATELLPATYWRDLLYETGFTLQRETDVAGLLTYLRADKLTPAVGRQLQLGLE